MSLKLMKERWLSETQLDQEQDPVMDMEMSDQSEEKPKEELACDPPHPPAFIAIKENVVMCDESLIKEAAVVRCFCEPTEQELAAGQGCGDTCINRMLYTECGSRCPSGASCSNRRLHNQEYAKVEAFYAGAKGWGLRACEQLQQGCFIMEYVGEVISAEDMRRRVRRYAKDPSHVHHYLMALKNGAVIDATVKGNISRFINHSCDPNCRSEKWMVDRRVRIGFFAIKRIERGEELVFDYQLELYGRKAQRCYCGAPNCRGLIGVGEEVDGEGDDVVGSQSESDSEPELVLSRLSKRKAPRRRLKKHDLTHNQQAIDAALEQGAPRNRSQVKSLVQLMIHVERADQRSALLSCFCTAPPDIIRLLMEECGLRLLYIFLASEYPADSESAALRVYVNTLDVLDMMPVSTSNQVVDSHLIVTLNRLIGKHGPIDRAVECTMDALMGGLVGGTPHSPSPPGDGLGEALHREMVLKIHALLNKWKSLREEFRIPRRERSDTPLSEHEREEDDKKHRRSVLLEQKLPAVSFRNHRIIPPHFAVKRPFITKKDASPPPIRRSRFDVVGGTDQPPPPPTLLPEEMFSYPPSPMPYYPYYYQDVTQPYYYNYLNYYPAQHKCEAMSILEAPSPPSEPMPDMLSIGDFNLDKITEADVELVEKSLAVMKERLHELKSKQCPQPPPPPPQPRSKWVQATTEEGSVYYYHKDTRETVWTLPEEGSTDDMADTTSDHGDARAVFKAAIAKHIATVLEPIRKTRFSSPEDYKYVVRKLTHTVLEKESKRVGCAALKATDSVKEKARRFADDYIARLGSGVYCRKNSHHNTY